MATIQWRPEVNALTTPQSYRLRFIPRAVLGYEELTAEIVRDNPTWNESLVKAVLHARDEKIKEQLINGNQVTLEDAFSYRLSFHARLEEPDDPPPAPEDTLRVKISVSRPFVKEVRQSARMERLPAEEKLPLITSAEDTELEMNNTLYNSGVLRLTGNDLFFNRKAPDCGCIIQGTRSGRAVQTRFASISNTEVLVVPNIPLQDDPWNNEYTVSLSTQYTEHGTLRTSTYRRRLRTPLEVTGFGHPNMEVGILTGRATAPYVTVTGGWLSADGMMRIQAVLDPREGHILCSLLDMRADGMAGDPVAVRENGDCILSGFTDSVLSSLDIRVSNYAALLNLVRKDYAGRLVDILEVKA